MFACSVLWCKRNGQAPIYKSQRPSVLKNGMRATQQASAKPGSRDSAQPCVTPPYRPAGSGVDVMRAASRLPMNDQMWLAADAPACDDSLPVAQAATRPQHNLQPESLLADPDHGPKRAIPSSPRLYIPSPSILFSLLQPAGT